MKKSLMNRGFESVRMMGIFEKIFKKLEKELRNSDVKLIVLHQEVKKQFNESKVECVFGVPISYKGYWIAKRIICKHELSVSFMPPMGCKSEWFLIINIFKREV